MVYASIYLYKYKKGNKDNKLKQKNYIYILYNAMMESVVFMRKVHVILDHPSYI